MISRDAVRTNGERGGGFAYVALGDSISIDLYAGGPGRGGASLLARNRDDDFPDWAGRDLDTTVGPVAFSLLATDGGTTSTLLRHQLPHLEASGVRPRLVTLTIGGNDVLGAFGNTSAALSVVSRVGQDVAEALSRVRRLMAGPDDPIVVGTVYDPSDGTANTASVGLPPWPELVLVLTELNNELRRRAVDAGARVAKIAEHFAGHGLAAGNPGQRLNRPADRRLWYCNVIEPNAWGASGVRAAFWEAAAVQASPPRPAT